jgi:hypothetical protein
MRLTRTTLALTLIAGMAIGGCKAKEEEGASVSDTRPEPVARPLVDGSAETTKETAGATKTAIDAESGLLIDDHWQLVKAHCSVCHSLQLITQQRGSRQTWLSLIRWMQETQGLWAFDEVTESGILDYLEKNYAPLAVSTRAPIPVDLMPENPYSKTEKR